MAGNIAAVTIAVLGAVVGGVGAYVSKVGAGAEASPTPVFSGAPKRFQSSEFGSLGPTAAGALETPRVKPEVIIIIDDVGPDIRGSREALNLPGPVTYALLPYAIESRRFASTLSARGDEFIVHLPMEPKGDQDPGPNALRANMTGVGLLQALQWNLDQFSGYVGVNNHMGSKLTADGAAMRTVLSILDDRGLFFLDSVTTGKSAVASAGERVGATVISRDIFLDSRPGNKDFVRRQIKLMEKIAIERGRVIAIAHPRRETLDVLGPWLTTAEARGFRLARLSEAAKDAERAKAYAAVTSGAPVLRR